jgi:hypothetical protein
VKLLAEFNWDHINEAVNDALAVLLGDRDRVLFEVRANERAITHRLAHYLETATKEFDGWDIDCEYNRIGKDSITPKRLGLDLAEEAIPIGRSGRAFAVPVDDDRGSLVFPDIVVHRRGDPESNLLVIEVKTNWSQGSQKHDWSKLRAFTDGRRFQWAAPYRFGLFIRLSRDGTYKIRQFENKANL